MWNWTEQTLISQGQGWLRSLAQLTQFRDSRPRVGRTDKPHQTMSLSVICLKSGKVEGEGSGGWSVFSRMGEWCLNTKINLFHFQKHYLFIIFLIFIFFGAGGGALVDAPRQRPHGHNCVLGPWPVRAPSVPPKRLGWQDQGRAAPGHVPGSCCALTPGADGTNLSRRSGHREGPCQVW